MSFPINIYEAKKQAYELQLLFLKKRLSFLSVLRLTLFVGALTVIIGLWSVSKLIALIAGIALFTAFLILLKVYEKTKQKRQLTQNLLTINQKELWYNQGKTNVFDSGNQFADNQHQYSSDLDFFTQNGIFQLINRGVFYESQKMVANTLKYYYTQEHQIIERQKAHVELEPLIDFRQHIWAHAQIIKPYENSFNETKIWLQQPPSFQKKWVRWLLAVTPIVSILVTLLAAFSIITWGMFLLYTLLPLSITGFHLKTINKNYVGFGKSITFFKALSELFQVIEKQNFKSSYLNNILKHFFTVNKPSILFKKLSKIAAAFDQRNNILMGIVLNIYFLWDLRQANRVEKWKIKYRSLAQGYFENIFEMEQLISFATFGFNHPKYCVPLISEIDNAINAQNLGHPLIHESKRIDNNVNLQTQNHFVILTGSNMAGKSTFLRAIGVNLVLACCGARVCATSFTFKPMPLVTGMRTADNLTENASYFFAELKRLKTIIEAYQKGEKPFVMLDEILKGTNSKDKEEGSKLLIEKLLKLNAGGIIATHDLALTQLAEKFTNQISNFTFESQIVNNELYFDYTLKEGVCRNLNASFLMNKMGIT